jgi:methylated-DNA-protein-cysteine methyltransferase-like protein
MAKSKFTKCVINTVRAIPKGKVASYGQVALYVGIPRAALQVGWVLHQHGDDGITPWWRVINNQGRISTKCIEHHANIQKTYLEKEGLQVTKGLNIDIEKYRWRPDPKTLKKHKLSEEYIEQAIDKYGI